ncbi:MAG: hypothetical protein J6B55_05425 [Clostridia bacterium]|nr:hypothetical protein [Clostridia bacterium]
MANENIKSAAAAAGVRVWELAETGYGITDGAFSRKLRKELPEAEQARLLRIIDEITAQRKEG